MGFRHRDSDQRWPVGLFKLAAPKPVSPWRWFALLAVVVAFAHDRLPARLDGSLEARLLRAGSALVPVHATFGAWRLILLILLGFAVFQLAKGQRNVDVHDRVSKHVVVASLLASLLLVSPPSIGTMTASLATALAIIAASAYVRVQSAVGVRRVPSWLGVPFALLLGFTMIVALAAIAAAGLPTSILIVMVGAVCIATIWSGLHFGEPALPGFVAWIFTSICAENRSELGVASVALLGGGACAAVAILIAATRVASPKSLPRPHRAR